MKKVGMSMKGRKWTLYDYLVNGTLAVYAIICTAPLLLMFMVSITEERWLFENGYSFFPGAFSLAAYEMIFTRGAVIANSYLVSTAATVMGTVLAVLITALAGYVLANPNVKYRNHMAFIFFIPMLFSVGIVPWYMINDFLGLKNNFLALIIPRLVFNPFYMFLVRNYVRGLPVELGESAKIDGAGEFAVAFRIYFPLCMPVLASIALFYGLGYWNDWYNAVMLIRDTSLYPLQFLLFELQSQISMAIDLQKIGVEVDLPSESFKMATAIITIGPIILLYPSLQKYFVKGLVVGAVKG